MVGRRRAYDRIVGGQGVAGTEGGAGESQRLGIPGTVEGWASAAAAIEENASLLKDLGFEIEAFGGSSVLVRAVRCVAAVGVGAEGAAVCKEALRLAAGTPPPDLVLMDRALPDQDGIDVTRALKAANPSLVVIAVSAHAMASDHQRARAAGCGCAGGPGVGRWPEARRWVAPRAARAGSWWRPGSAASRPRREPRNAKSKSIDSAATIGASAS